MNRPTELLVLAGGFGVRLRSTIPNVPKPLAPVNGRPFLSYLVQNWVRQGITSFTFLLHHQAPLIEAFLAEEQHSGLFKECRVRVVLEPRPLNTGGAIAHAVRKLGIKKSFLVANADTWLECGLEAIARAGSPALGVVRVSDCNRYGAVPSEKNKAAVGRVGSTPDSIIWTVNYSLIGTPNRFRWKAVCFRDWWQQGSCARFRSRESF